MSKKTVRKTAVIGVSVAACMMLSYVESLYNFGIPGIKLGLPNVFVISILYLYGVKYAVPVSAVKCLLSSLLFGSVVSFWYSASGAALSLILMVLMKRTGKFSTVGVSVTGGVSHNVAQIIVALVITETKELLMYLPVLVLSGCVAGVLIGVASSEIIKRIKVN